jgi:Leucine rich repeat
MQTYVFLQMQNVVESLDNPVLSELRLGHNKLTTLDGFLLGLRNLRFLDLSHNEMRYLPPDELVGLDNLRLLDISHNQISTLADTSQVSANKLIVIIKIKTVKKLEILYSKYMSRNFCLHWRLFLPDTTSLHFWTKTFMDSPKSVWRTSLTTTLITSAQQLQPRVLA